MVRNKTPRHWPKKDDNGGNEEAQMNALTFKRGAVILAISLACIACSPSQPNGAAANGAYPQDVTDEFMKGCTKSGSGDQYCSCVFAKVQTKYSLEEFTEIEAKLKAGTPPEDFVEFSRKASAECLPTK